MTRDIASSDHDWVTQQLSDPEFRRAFNQERAVREFQDQLQSVLEQRGFTQKDLAERLGKSAAFVSQCMRRGSNLTIATMSELASACGFELHIRLRRQASDAGAIFSEPDWSAWKAEVRAKVVGGPLTEEPLGNIHVVPWMAYEMARSPPECSDWPRNTSADANVAFAAFCSHQLGLNA